MKTQSAAVGESEPTRSVFGVASSRIQANRIVDHLTNAGFAREDISVIFPNGDPAGRSAGGAGARTTVGEGAALQIGLAVGGAIGWLAGLDTLSIPGFGHLITGGPVGAVLMGAAAGPAATQGIKSALVGLGMRNADARLYQDSVREGQILICLRADEWRQADAARKIFQAMDATNITIGGAKASGMLTRAISRVTGRRSPALSSHPSRIDL